jgi:hypothetical protein
MEGHTCHRFLVFWQKTKARRPGSVKMQIYMSAHAKPGGVESLSWNHTHTHTHTRTCTHVCAASAHGPHRTRGPWVSKHEFTSGEINCFLNWLSPPWGALPAWKVPSCA